MTYAGDGGTRDYGSDEFAAANEPAWSKANLRDNVEMGIDRARDVVARGDAAMRSIVHERPFVAVGMALAIGYLISRGLARD